MNSVSRLGFSYLLILSLVSGIVLAAVNEVKNDSSIVGVASQSANESQALKVTIKRQLESEPVSEEVKTSTTTTVTLSPEDLLPKEESLFQKDSIDREELLQLDCHLRNLDYCYAGILGSAQKVLPETDSELESRCDAMKATTYCLLIYHQRCSSFNVFEALAPFADIQSIQRQQIPKELQTAELPQFADELVLNRNLSNQAPGIESRASPMGLSQQQQRLQDQTRLTMANLVGLCEPSSKGTEPNKLLRRRLFKVAKCINSRMPYLRPCIEDMKTSIQVFFEPGLSLPLKPSCCAMSRFRDCASKALDGVCGLTSFELLEKTLNSGPTSMVKTIGRVCRNAARFDSPYCQEILPPSGLRAPPRRGRKASKLAKALDLIQFAPATQDAAM